jgi:hypothetical protein
MKNGILNLPDSTRSRNDCNVDPSKGSAPQTSTYNTTPSDCGERKMKGKSLVSLNYTQVKVVNTAVRFSHAAMCIIHILCALRGCGGGRKKRGEKIIQFEVK